MKKFLLVFSMIVAVSSVKAQEASSFKKFSFGLKAAPGLSWFKPESNLQRKDGLKLSFGYGIMTEFNFTENYCFATGLEVNHYAGAIRTTDVFGEVSAKTKIQYLTLPLTLKMKTKEIGALKYFGQFGLASSFALKSKADVTTNYGGVVTSYNDRDADAQVATFKESLLIGLGAEYNLVGSTSAVFSVTYDNGFTNINSKEVRLLPGYPGKLSNKAVVFTIGVLF